MKTTNNNVRLALRKTLQNHTSGIRQTNLKARKNLMKKQCLGIVMAVCFACCAFAQDNSTLHALRPYDKNHPPTSNCNGNPCDINYNGGGVFETVPNLYLIWYGNWSNQDRGIIDYYFSHLGGTSQERINTTYSDSKNKFVPNGVHIAKDYHDNYSLGKALTGDAQIQEIVANAINGGHVANDGGGIYFVLTYKDVTLPGFCSSFCGYHGPSTSIVSGKTIKYSFVGDPDQCKGSCETSYILGDKSSPNHDPGADGTTAIMWHEFSESSSDPEVNIHTAWVGNFCGESGDCCAWLFGTVKKNSGGHYYTNTIGKKQYVMQEMLELRSTSRTGNIPGLCKNTF
jgi:hypothetical protein